MFNAKYKKGMADAAKPYEAFGEKQEAALNHILEEVRQGKKSIEEDISALNDNLDGLYNHLKSKDKANLYTIHTPFDIKELGDQERFFLLGALLRLTVDKTPNENQQNYIRAVQRYLGVTELSAVDDLMAIENIEDIPSQKAILQTVLEYLRLQDGDDYDETELQQEFLDAFCLSNKVKNEIIQHVELLYSATGAQGLAEKYGYVPEEDIIECQSSDVPDSNYPITMGENLCDEIFDFLVRKKLSGRFQETDRYFIYTTWYDDQADVYSVNKQNGEKKCCLTQKEIQQVTGSVGYFSLECKPIIDDTVLLNEYSNNYKNQDIYALDIAQRKIEHLFTCSGDDDLYVPSCRYMIMANRITRDIKLYDCNTRKMRLVRTPDRLLWPNNCILVDGIIYMTCSTSREYALYQYSISEATMTELFTSSQRLTYLSYSNNRLFVKAESSIYVTDLDNSIQHTQVMNDITIIEDSFNDIRTGWLFIKGDYDRSLCVLNFSSCKLTVLDTGLTTLYKIGDYAYYCKNKYYEPNPTYYRASLEHLGEIEIVS